jgi:DNA modification methylase
MSSHASLLEHAKGLPRSPIHSFHRYFGKLIPAIPAFAIQEFTRPGDVVLDPFCGSGTTLVEAKLNGRNSIGVELNPLARLIAQVKTTTYDITQLKSDVENICRRAEQLLGLGCLDPLPYCVNMDHWFQPHIQHQLSSLRAAIHESTSAAGQDFFLAVFSSIIRNVSNADPRHIFPGYSKRLRSLDVEGAQRPQPLEIFPGAARKRIAALSSYRDIPETFSRVIAGDACRLSEYHTGTVDLIVTNPPYISSIRYLETIKLEMSWLGMLAGQSDYISLDRRILGSERFYRSEYQILPETGVASVDQLTAKLYMSGHHKMSYTVARYFHGLSQSLSEMTRALRPGGHLVVKISGSYVRGFSVPTHRIFSELAMEKGLHEVDAFPDKIRGRSLLTRRNSYSKMIDHDWILIFRKG